MLATLYIHIDSGEEVVIAKRFRESLYGQDILTAQYIRLKGEFHLGCNLGRFVEPFYLGEHLFTALSSLYGFFTVELFELCDDLLLVLYFLLLVQVSFHHALSDFGAFAGKICVVAVVHLTVSVV